MTKMRPRLASARAYFRLAAKASRAGNSGEAEHYRKVANRFVDQDRREQESRVRYAKSRAEYDKKREAAQAARAKETA